MDKDDIDKKVDKFKKLLDKHEPSTDRISTVLKQTYPYSLSSTGVSESRRAELLDKIDNLHSRITTNTKEIMVSAREQHEAQNKEIQKIREELSARMGILEKWRHVLIGGSIVVGFMLHKFIDYSP